MRDPGAGGSAPSEASACRAVFRVFPRSALCAVWVLIASYKHASHAGSAPILTTSPNLNDSLKTQISKVSPILRYWGVRTSTYAFSRDPLQPPAHSQASCIFRLSPWEGRRLGWRACGHPGQACRRTSGFLKQANPPLRTPGFAQSRWVIRGQCWAPPEAGFSVSS